VVNEGMDAFRGLAFCPACGCLDARGSVRCMECSTFHSGSILEERDAPREPAPKRNVDPSQYSLSGQGSETQETFEQAENIRTWSGGNTDFSFSDDEQPPALIDDPEELLEALPSPEELLDIQDEISS